MSVSVQYGEKKTEMGVGGVLTGLEAKRHQSSPKHNLVILFFLASKHRQCAAANVNQRQGAASFGASERLARRPHRDAKGRAAKLRYATS